MLTKEPIVPSMVNPLVPMPLDALVLAMLAKDSGIRPTAEEVVRMLDEFQDPTKISLASISGVWRWMITAAVLLAACFAAWRWKQAGEQHNTPSFRQTATLVPKNRATAGAISPDGTQAAYANIDGIFIRTIQNGRTKALNSPGDYVVDRIAWFADGRKLAADGREWFVSVDTTLGHRLLYVYRGGRFRSLGDFQGWAVPSPDGHRVAFLDRIVAANAWTIERH